jgi:hypothetical protein
MNFQRGLDPKDAMKIGYYREDLLGRLIAYIAKRKIGDLVYRSKIIENIDTFGSYNSTDSYRNYLTKAGYLKLTERSGIYEYAKEIPLDLSLKQLLKEAYPKK